MLTESKYNFRIRIVLRIRIRMYYYHMVKSMKFKDNISKIYVDYKCFIKLERFAKLHVNIPGYHFVSL